MDSYGPMGAVGSVSMGRASDAPPARPTRALEAVESRIRELVGQLGYTRRRTAAALARIAGEPAGVSTGGERGIEVDKAPLVDGSLPGILAALGEMEVEVKRSAETADQLETL